MKIWLQKGLFAFVKTAAGAAKVPRWRERCAQAPSGMGGQRWEAGRTGCTKQENNTGEAQKAHALGLCARGANVKQGKMYDQKADTSGVKPGIGL